MRFVGRNRWLTAGFAAIVAVGAMGVGVAVAQDGGEPPAVTEDGARHQHAHHRVLKGLMKSIVENSGLEPAAFREGFAAGKSINDVLEENGVDPAAVQDAVLTDLDEKLDELVAAGTLTQPQADRMYAAAEQHLPTLMERTPDGDRPHRGPGHRFLHGIRGLIGSAAEGLSMEPRELAARLRGGESVADVAADQGVDLETLRAAILSDANARIDEAVAAGRLDEAEAEELRSRIVTRTESFLTERRGGRE